MSSPEKLLKMSRDGASAGSKVNGQEIMATETDIEHVPSVKARSLHCQGSMEHTSSSDGDNSNKWNSARRVSFLLQVYLLLWKNVTQHRRSVMVTIAECIIPLLGAVLMIVIRQLVIVREMPRPTVWDTLAIDVSAGQVFRGTYGRVLYTPNTCIAVNKVMTEVDASFKKYGLGAKTMGFVSEDELLNFYSKNTSKQALYPLSVIFNITQNLTIMPFNVTVTLRPQTQDDDKWMTSRIFPFLQVLSPRNDVVQKSDLYYQRGFLFAQRIISEALISHWVPAAASTLSRVEWAMNRMPYPPYIKDAMTQVQQENFPTLLMLSFILSVIIMCKGIVTEKERQLKESMKLMGISAAANWTSWFVMYFVYLFVACSVYTLFMCVEFTSKPAVLIYSSPSLIFVFLLSYSVCVVCYCFFISTLVNTANIAAAVGGIMFYIAFFPYNFLEPNYENMSLNDKCLACISFNLAMSYGMKTIGMYEASGRGAQWDNFVYPASVDGNFTLFYAIMWLFVDAFVFLMLTWYIDNVNPGTYGVPKPWYFPFKVSYWFGGRKKHVYTQLISTEHCQTSTFEQDPVSLPVGISMLRLRKKYAADKIAVRDATLNMYEGQISVLLGHNGAGKTTTMSMLTGFLPPTSGTAIINNYDIRTNIDDVRMNLGLCPQHNILFDTLTVNEHLQFFARLKGCPRSRTADVVAATVEELGLGQKRHSLAKTLSGGQKRKLSVGIALIGGSKIVILDEPTSGMDPASRRQTWDMLQRNRAGRTILLSTHFMDEADVLGDRIAIMADGAIKCCGTSLFLKKLYGAGYHMIAVKQPGCDVSRLTTMVQQHVPGARLEWKAGAEVSYLLSEDKSAHFADLFRMMEAQSQDLGISSFGATSTTMEEVFLRVSASGCEAEEDVSHNSEESFDPPLPASNHSGNVVNDIGQSCDIAVKPPKWINIAVDASDFSESLDDEGKSFDVSYQRLDGVALDVSRFWSMLVKKAIHTWRNRVMSVIQLALPVIFTILALCIDKIVGPHQITVINHPMPKPEIAQAEDSLVRGLELGFSIGFCLLFGMTFLSASFAYFLIRERESGAKHLQVVSGIGPLTFWLSTYVWDVINYIIPCLVLLVVFAGFQVDAYMEDGNMAVVLLTLLLFGLAVIPFTYILQSGFSSPATGFVMIIIFSILSGLFTMMVVFILRIPSLHTEHTADILDWVFMAVFPHYSLGLSFTNMYVNKLDKDACTQGFIDMAALCPFFKEINATNPCCRDLCGPVCVPFTDHIMDWKYPGIGRNLMFLTIQAVIYMSLTLALEYQAFRKLKYIFFRSRLCGVNNISTLDDDDVGNEDSDVATERRRVESGQAYGETVVLYDLTKTYPNCMAVDRVSVGVPENECFGLLGLNGAGKTTTFKLLTGDVLLTSGDAFVLNNSVTTDISKVQGNMGYCPQFDALIDQMTGRETLFMYARLRGVPADVIHKAVGNLISLLMLDGHADQLIKNYSGGNKRKLSTAVALVGGPAVILLDEPSSGMDPGARRKLWNVLSQVRASGRTLILTSHRALKPKMSGQLLCHRIINIAHSHSFLSDETIVVGHGLGWIKNEQSNMEECDALCTRIVIMVNGRFKCLGSPQHLKSKFGHGYTLIVKMATSSDGGLATMWPLVDCILDSFPGAQKFDEHHGYIHFQIPDSSIPLSSVFSTMEHAKEELGVEHYSVHQTSLEQVFLMFARTQSPACQYSPRMCFQSCCSLS